MRVSGNTPYIRTPRTPKRSSRRTLVILLITIVLPPLGLILLWRAGRCPLRGKVLITMLGVAIMVLGFSIYIGRQIPKGVEVLPDYSYPSATQAPDQPGELGIVEPPPGAEGTERDGALEGGNSTQSGDTGGGEEELPEGVVPPNPAS